MGWREDLIQSYKKQVADLRQDIEMMGSGQWEMRSRNPDGTWTVMNNGLIARDQETIQELEAIIARAEAERDDADTAP